MGGLDFGTQQKVKDKPEKSEILSPVLIMQYKLDPKWSVAGRMEYYEDKDGVLIANGLKTTGYSLNLDYTPVSNAVVRLEGKTFGNSSAVLTGSIAVAF